MKNERIEILQKVANGELTPEQADEQLLGLFIVSKRYYNDFVKERYEGQREKNK